MQAQTGSGVPKTTTSSNTAIKVSPGENRSKLKTSKKQVSDLVFVTDSLDKIKGSLWGIYIGDALAMPTHWYYDQSHLRRTYGQITGYVKPQDKLPGSIMSLSNTGGGGRGSNSGEIVGSVILHGKKKYWERGADWFYHRGMAAGALIARTEARLRLTTPRIAQVRTLWREPSPASSPGV